MRITSVPACSIRKTPPTSAANPPADDNQAHATIPRRRPAVSATEAATNHSAAVPASIIAVALTETFLHPG
jgi:hypothetical protein